MGTKGHFYEQRYYSGALLSEAALLAAMAYVDLNPVRAGLAERIEACRETSIAERLQENSAEALEAYLAPLVSGLDAGEVRAGSAEVPSAESSATVPAAGDEIRTALAQSPFGWGPARCRTARCRPVHQPARLRSAWCAPWPRRSRLRRRRAKGRVAEWLARNAVLGKRQRAYGPRRRLADWIERRGLQLRETPLPA